MTSSILTLEIIGALTLFASIVFVIGMKYGKNKSLPNLYSDFAVNVPSYFANQAGQVYSKSIYERLVGNNTSDELLESDYTIEAPLTFQNDSSNYTKTTVTPRMTIVAITNSNTKEVI